MQMARQKAPKNPEVKFWDSGIFTSTIDNSGANILDCCAISQGAGVDQRIGQQLSPLYLDLGYSIVSNSGALASTSVRVVVVQSMGYEISLPSIDQILNTAQGTGTFADTWLWFQYPAQSKALRLLHDEKIIVSKFGQFGDLAVGSRRINLKGARTVDYSGVSTSVNDNAGGRIYAYFFSSEPNANGQAGRYFCRLTYTD